MYQLPPSASALYQLKDTRSHQICSDSLHLLVLWQLALEDNRAILFSNLSVVAGKSLKESYGVKLGDQLTD